MSSSVKIHLVRESDDCPEVFIKIETRKKPRIRSTYVALCEDLKATFPILKEQSIPWQIKWQDSEGDRITISSELDVDIFYEEGGKLLYVIMKKGQEPGAQKAESSDDVIHPSIICDACEKTVRGFRYKCLVCSDYDLCAACEASACHPEHYMIRVPKPVAWNRRCMPRVSRRFMRHAKKSAKGHEEEKCSRDSDPGAWKIMENLGQILTDWANSASETAPTQESEAAKEEAKPAKSPSSVLNDLRQSPLCDNVLFKMQNLLDNSLQFLDPLGVDVSVSFEPPLQERVETPKTPETLASETPKTLEKETVVENNPAPVESDKISKPMTVGQVSGVEGESSGSASPKSDKASPSRSNAEVEGWTLLGATESLNSSSKPEVAESKPLETEKPLYPPLPPTYEPEGLYHPDPKIHRAVKVMMEMGFTNEGGWLTQLLISKGGDISKALDVLQPMMNR